MKQSRSSVQTSGLAIASMILGIGSILICGGPLPGIPAVICGHIALNNIQQRPELNQSGRGLAVTGLITGYREGATETLEDLVARENLHVPGP